jgi:Putative bacterial sensory transduction regulator
MKSAEDVESYLMRLDLPYETLKPGIWIVKLNHEQNLAVSIAGPVVAFRIKVMDLPAAGRESLYRTLLQLNTSEMVHGAFGMEGDAIVIVHALELENLDFNEFQAVIDDMAMAIAKHYPNLSGYLHGRPASPSVSA